MISMEGISRWKPNALLEALWVDCGGKLADRPLGPDAHKHYKLTGDTWKRLKTAMVDKGWIWLEFDADNPPDFARFNYANKHVWIYSPASGNGNFRDEVYTRVWRVSHEWAHAMTNDQLTADYGGQGKRRGALGDGLGVADCLRAVDWEYRTFAVQAGILHRCGVPDTDPREMTYWKENAANMLDAVVRCLTGEFSDPATSCIIPAAIDPAFLLNRAHTYILRRAAVLGLPIRLNFN